jgi:predicted RNA binding protein YcfA (HicA-like mRNA interferase family)
MKPVKDFIGLLQSRKRNIRFREAEKMLVRSGFVERRSKKGTSHRVFSHPKLTYNITLVSHGRNDILPPYQVADMTKALEELEEITK